MLELLNSGTESETNWDAIQAVVDVWYVASIIDSKNINSQVLRPPESLLQALAGKMRSAYRQSSSPVDRIMYYVVGMSLDRLHVEGAPDIGHLSGRVLLQNRHEAISCHLHVSFDTCTFTTQILAQSQSAKMYAQRSPATDELIEMTSCTRTPWRATGISRHDRRQCGRRHRMTLSAKYSSPWYECTPQHPVSLVLSEGV